MIDPSPIIGFPMKIGLADTASVLFRINRKFSFEEVFLDNFPVRMKGDIVVPEASDTSRNVNDDLFLR